MKAICFIILRIIFLAGIVSISAVFVLALCTGLEPSVPLLNDLGCSVYSNFYLYIRGMCMQQNHYVNSCVMLIRGMGVFF